MTEPPIAYRPALEAEPVHFYCSFCGKSEREVQSIVKGPSVYICDECVAFCYTVLREQGVEPRLSPEFTDTIDVTSEGATCAG